jgi:RNA polymerase sigma factor (sigma-70 family)
MINPSRPSVSYMSVWSRSDEALLIGLAAGDRDAATGFVRRFQSRVYGLAVTILGDAGAAEDVAQETFVRAWRYAATYDARRGLVSTWLLTIARNLALDRARLRGADPVDPELIAFHLQRRQPAAGAEDAERIEQRDQMRELLIRLAPEQRRALVLAIYFGRTAREISELDGIPLGTAKTRIRDAVIKLRVGLEVEDEPR